MNQRFSVILIILCLSLGLFSQTKSGSKKQDIYDADEHFKHKNYLMAIPIYKAELKKDKNNKKIKYNLGICYLNTKINREESIKYFEDYSKEDKGEEEVWINLGRAYLLNNRIEDAKTAFEKFKSLKPKEAKKVQRYLENCDNAEKFIDAPSNVTFQNLGKEINSDEPDYYPFVSADETVLAFTSRRKENVGGKKVEMDGYHSSDVYYSKIENNNWTKAANAGKTINTGLDEQVVGLRPDGLELYVYLDHIDKFGDLYVSARKDVLTEFPKPKLCDPLINAKVETSGCLNEDGSIMVFARRDKITSNSDLYVCKKLPNGKWGMAQKLPPVINTEYNEDFPYLSNDCATLYFASEGHNSMGGYDLFKTEWNVMENTFSEPQNLGYPINSTDDDRNICVTPDDRVAYISAFRPGGFGDLDLYRIKFNENDQISKIFVGQIYLGDTTAKSKPKNYTVSMIVTNAQNKIEYNFTPHSKTGRFVMSLPAGFYKLSIVSAGYIDYKEEITISDFGKVDIEKNRNFILKPKPGYVAPTNIEKVENNKKPKPKPKAGVK
ncbi:MAG: PD40 domain-containing protein [Bacteroidia bacterium]|nr:PD40 domain-containing protein [Bacteroidia bacterium]